METVFIPHTSLLFGYYFPPGITSTQLYRLLSIDNSLRIHPQLKHLTVLPLPSPIPEELANTFRPQPQKPNPEPRKTVRRHGKRRTKH